MSPHPLREAVARAAGASGKATYVLSPQGVAGEVAEWRFSEPTGPVSVVPPPEASYSLSSDLVIES